MRPAGLGIRQVFLKSCAEMHLWGAALEGEDPNVFDAACITQTMGETTSHYAFQSEAIQYLVMTPYYNI